MEKRRPIIWTVVSVAIILIVSLLYYFLFFDKPSLSPFEVNVTVGNNLPQIVYASPVDDPPNLPVGSVSPVQSGVAQAIFVFTTYDIDGSGSINDTSAAGIFTKTGQTARQNISCDVISGQTTLNTKNYSCSVEMWFFDSPGTWSVNASIADLASGKAENTTTTFEYETLSGFTFSPSGLSWNTLSVSDKNQTSNNDPLLINNTGNGNFTLNITGYDLSGAVNPNDYIFAGNFSVSTVTGGNGCVGSACLECAGNVMSNNTGITVTNSQLLRGNYTLNNGTGQEQLYFCIPSLNPLPPDTYSTSGTGNSWKLELGGGA